ncbi:MAG: chromate transporter [Clostridia bacterium]
MIYFKLFYTFFLIGLFTFGGGQSMLPFIQQQVLLNNWLSEDMLINIIAISESTPGPIAINAATYIGAIQGGIFGSICATLGVVLPSFIIILIIARFASKILQNKFADGILLGIRPVIIGLITATGLYFVIKSLLPAFSINNMANISMDFRALGIIIVLVLFNVTAKIAKKKTLSPILTICISAIAGMIVYSF